MSVAHSCHGAITQTGATAFNNGCSASIHNGPRVGISGHVSARLAVSTPDHHLCNQLFNATAVWRACNLEGYLGRKLHRQWRNRGS